MGVRIDKLVGPPHFLRIQDMMALTDRAMLMLPDLLDSVYQQDLDRCEQFSTKISQLENEVDQLKHGLRQRVYTSLFFFFPKRDFLDFVTQLDSLTDRCELLAKTYTYRVISTPERLKSQVERLLQQELSLYKRLSTVIVDELPGLFEASFSGLEAHGVLDMIDDLVAQAHPLREQIHQAMVELFQAELSVSELLIWQKALTTLENLGISIEKSATALRSLMEK